MELITQKMCMTKNIGVNDNLFGGEMLSLLDESAAIYASLVIHNPKVVTVFFSGVTFKKSVHVGELIRVYGEVVEMGTTSITVKIEANIVNVYTKEEEVCCDTVITFVRVDERNKKIPISDTVRERYKNVSKAANALKKQKQDENTINN